MALRLLTLLLALLGLSILTQAQTLTPFTTGGYVTSMTRRDATNPRSGGTISVNGMTITVPDNLQVGFPAAFIPYAQVAGSYPGFGGDGPIECSIIGNIVDGTPIAGLIDFGQPLLGSSQGIIERVIAGPNPEIKIANGPSLIINDPNAVYSSGYKDKPFFTADDENPSISTFAGFPMCIPRTADVEDPLCPSTNRPKADNTMPDNLVMMPFKAGDYLDFSGIMVGGKMVCFSIVANVLVTSTDPGYIRMEDALVGVIDPDANVEFSQSKFIGFTTNPTGVVDISALDIDPCTGVTTDRLLKTGQATEAGGIRNRFRWLTDRLSIGAYTREYHIVLQSGTKKTKNGILAGQYVQPVTEWVFPELTAIGQAPPSNEFSMLGHLANGVGPDETPERNVYHQLDPWPGRYPKPAPSKMCPDTAPPDTAPPATSPPPADGQPVTGGGAAVTLAADAGQDVTVRPGSLVTLTAKQTSPGIDPATLKYSWLQVGTANPVPAASITGTDKAAVNIILPVQGTAPPIVREFEVTITHTPSGSTAKKSVKITTDLTVRDAVVIDSYTRISSQSGTISVAAHSNLVLDAAGASVQIKVGAAANAPWREMVKQGTNTGKWTYSQRSTAANVAITVRTVIGGKEWGSASRGTNTLTRRRRWGGVE